MENSDKNGVQSADAATVKAWLEQDKIVLVDVRETSEFDREHIPGAMLLPMSKFDAELFPSVPGKTVVLHCAVGKRSESAGKMLLKEGHSGAVHLSGGIDAWKAAGYATEIQFTPPVRPSESKPEQAVFLCPSPGEVLKEEYLKPHAITATDLAGILHVAESDITDLIAGVKSVDVVLSLRLARYFSTAASFWIHLQMEHDLEQARHRVGTQIKRDITPRA